MVNFEEETQKIENWQQEQEWKTKDPFTHLTNADLFVGFDDLLKKFYHFATLGKNYAVIYGQYGYGKTAFLKKIANEYSKKYNVVMFEDVPDREYVAEKIKKLCSGKMLRTLTFQKIDSYDYTSFNKLIKKRTILIFDEAHSLDEKTFSYVRSLSENGKTFSIIFAGKPELVMGKKAIPHYLLDRLELTEGMRTLNEKESIELIKKRVDELAESNNYLFTEKAMKKISLYSQYIPREILENCSKLIEYAIQNNLHEINEKHVSKFLTIVEETKTPTYTPETTIKYEEDPEEKLHTYARIMEGNIPKHTPRASYNVEREEFLRELSPLQKQIVLYLFDHEPKTARDLSHKIDGTYDTIRHMIKRLQGKYNESNSKPKIKELFPLITEKNNPNGRGYVYSLSTQTRKILSTD